MSKGIIYEYQDGGTYVGEWEDDTSHGYGICTGPNGQGKFEGMWEHGKQISGVYTWPKGMKYMGTWNNSLRDGTGKEVQPDGTEYSGDFTKGSRGPFGVTKLPNGVYRGSWHNGTQDGEGVEAYVDGGYYRGQYKKGVRHGYGTRSSASYEKREGQSPLPKNFSDPKISSLHSFSKHQSSVSSLKSPPHSTPSSVAQQSDGTSTPDRKDKATSFAVNASQASKQDLNAQIYSGEWKEDKRHGYGVLKVLGLYTYYGEWNQNARTGYGVLSYESGRKEEGLWQNGKLIEVFKRKKISFKTSQLETKINQAHTNAIQAADVARNKAMLSESRASTAIAKSRVAQKSAQQAVTSAQYAKNRADLYKNAPKITENLKTPMVEMPIEFPAVDRTKAYNATSGSMSSISSSKTTDSGKMSLLGVNTKVTPSTSFEDIHSILYNRTHSDSEESLEGPEDSITLLRNRRGKLSMTSSGSRGSEDDILRAKRQRFIERMSASSEAGSTFDLGYGSFEHRESQRKRRVSDTAVDSVPRKKPLTHLKSSSLNEEGEEQDEFEDNMYCRRRKKVDATTGEINHGDITDDELLEDKKLRKSHLPAPRHPLVKRNSATTEMLIKMADWNRMVAYINFFLLLFLLVLILIVVMTLQYSQLASYYYNHPPEEGNQAANFLTPMV